MTRPTLQNGAKGAAVKDLQRLLNRIGGLLAEDGDFGGGTERAVREAQQQAGVAVTGIADETTWEWLERQPDPSSEISVEAITFIVAEEVGGRRYYDAHVCHPHYPGGASGVTIGVGYDLRFQSENFENDWGDELAAADRDRLRAVLGRQGDPQLVQGLADITVPFPCAWRVFIEKTLPRYVTQTRDAFEGYDGLPPLCKGVLVSLVYNRGPGMDGESRKEMRDIRTAVANGNLAAVPDALRAMKRLWPNLEGLRKRRDREADLWQRGLEEAAIA